MEKITYKTLEVLLDEYEVEFIGDYRIKSNKLGYGYSGTIYVGGLGIKDMEEAKAHFHKPFKPRNIDIGYFDLEDAVSSVNALRKFGYTVDVITKGE